MSFGFLSVIVPFCLLFSLFCVLLCIIDLVMYYNTGVIFPSLFRFALCLRCRTGLCPRDLEDYGCSCRYLGGRGTVDDMDGCCFRHRGCYRAVTERGCRSQPDTTTYSVTCGHSNVTCGKGTQIHRSITTGAKHFRSGSKRQKVVIYPSCPVGGEAAAVEGLLAMCHPPSYRSA
uniref:Phospholipase A2 n=1 Tax=Paramormyrops kingsleyae TaxID=1676925 RepID=A0A3B3S0D9_9TELE